MAAKKTSRSDPFVSQANAESLVRYGPQISALTALMRQSEDTYNQTVAGAKSTAGLIQAAVDRAQPTVGAAYDRSIGQAGQAFGVAQPALNALPAGSPFTAVAGLEQAGLTGRLAESRASTLSELADRRVAAQEGSQYAQQAAGRTLASDRAKIGQQATDLAGQQGAFVADTIQQNIDASDKANATAKNQQANRDQTERDSLRSSGIDPDTGQPIPGGKLDPKTAAGKKWLSATAQGKAGDAIQGALNEAKTLKQSGAAREEAAQLLLQGSKDTSQTVYENVPVVDQFGNVVKGKTKRQPKLNRDGTVVTKTVPGLPKVNSQLLLSAALDMAYDGHLSRRNQQLLHARGIQLAPLGLVTYGQWQRQRIAAALPSADLPHGIGARP